MIFAWPGLVSRTLAVQVIALCLVAASAIVTHLRLDGWRYGELTTAGLVGANVTGAAVVMYAVVATVG